MGELQNKADELGDKAKEVAGDVVGNDGLANQGEGEQAASRVKQDAEGLKDKVTETLDKLTNR